MSLLDLSDHLGSDGRLRGIDILIDLLLDPVKPCNDIGEKRLDFSAAYCLWGGFVDT